MRYRKKQSVFSGLIGFIALIIWMVYMSPLFQKSSDLPSESSIQLAKLNSIVFQQFSPLIITMLGIIIVGSILALYIFIQQQRRLAKSGIAEIDKMEGHVFEEYLAILFRKLGYSAKVVGGSGSDFGADLVVEKDGVRTVVQAKRQESSLGIDAVSRVFSSKSHYNCQEALVVTNNYFSRMAKQLASDDHVHLWDRNILINNILKAQRKT